MSSRGNKSELPPIRQIAEELRGGADFEQFCEYYGVTESTLRSRLSYAGYGGDGHPRRLETPWEPLDKNAYGNYISGGVGGGDYRGLPQQPVLHTRKRREFVGLDWSASPATGPHWRWVQ